MATLVLSVIGDERTGLVEALSRVVADHGGNWDRSSMARLGSKFAGMVQISIPQERIDELVAALEPLAERGVLDISVERAEEAVAPEAVTLVMALVGQDRVGIVHEISAAVAEAGVSIVDLQTFTASAPMSAEQMFHAQAVLAAPEGVDRDDLMHRLEAIANELMVDLDLHPG